jgi:hypothetical protein
MVKQIGDVIWEIILCGMGHDATSDDPSPGAPPFISRGKIGGRARLGWLWEASWGGESVIIWHLFFRGTSTMRRAFE